MILRKFFSVLRKAEAIQRLAIEPFCQFVTRRVRMRTPACGLSMIFVVARQRCSEGGKPNRLMVKHSSNPSSRLAAADGYSRSSHSASLRMRAMPALASIFQAARIKLFTCSFCSSGR